jgi:hypothetical protein
VVAALPTVDAAALADDRRAVLLALLKDQLGELAERTAMEVEDLGSIFGWGRSTCYRAVREGLVPSVKVGKRIVVPVVGVAAVLLGIIPRGDLP